MADSVIATPDRFSQVSRLERPQGWGDHVTAFEGPVTNSEADYELVSTN